MQNMSEEMRVDPPESQAAELPSPPSTTPTESGGTSAGKGKRRSRLGT